MSIQILDKATNGFPEKLYQLKDLCPDRIFVRGNQTLLNSNEEYVAIIGSRDITPEEYDSAYQLGAKFSTSVVISGLARGVDAAAHNGCVNQGGRTIAVVATGLDRVYPKENAILQAKILLNDGLILSEQPRGVKANPTRLIARTRLQVALADKVIVVCCEIHSGTMHAANFARRHGIPIFAIDNLREGNRFLIENQIAAPMIL